jgi:hypothetical protein
LRHDPPRIVWSGRVWTSETEVRMPNYAVSEAEIASLAAYRAMVARYRAWAADLERALFGEDVPRDRPAAPVAVTPPEVGLFDDEEDG